MSSTRQVQAGERRRQNGWASAVEYDCLRGIDGTAVALKAALQDSPEKSELLYFLQALSLRDGGVNRIVAELLETFPARLGSLTMHKIGCKPGKRLSADQSDAISCELLNTEAMRAANLFTRTAGGCSEFYAGVEAKDVRTADEWIEKCRELAEAGLPDFIEELCCNPKIEIARQSESKSSYQRQAQKVLSDARAALQKDSKLSRERPELTAAVANRDSFRFAEVPYFHDVLGALFEYQCRYAERIRADFVDTSLSQVVFEAFDYALDTGRSALIEGNSGFGKTTALKACCAMNLGRTRYLQLDAITDRTAFAQKLSDATGVARGKGFSPANRLIRIQEFLRRSKIMLVIDEGQYLWPQGKRVTVHPELINWIGTALYNEGIPFVISATKQFTLRRQHVERQTDWSSEQLRRRTRKVFSLPESPTTEDMQGVARKLLGGLGEAAIDFVVGYAITSRGYFQTITDTFEDMQLIAKRAGREKITGKDLQFVVKEWRAPSDAALQRVFDSKPEGRRRAPKSTARPSDYESPDEAVNDSLNRGSRPVETGFSARETRPQGVPALAG